MPRQQPEGVQARTAGLQEQLWAEVQQPSRLSSKEVGEQARQQKYRTAAAQPQAVVRSCRRAGDLWDCIRSAAQHSSRPAGRLLNPASKCDPTPRVVAAPGVHLAIVSVRSLVQCSRCRQ